MQNGLPVFSKARDSRRGGAEHVVAAGSAGLCRDRRGRRAVPEDVPCDDVNDGDGTGREARRSSPTSTLTKEKIAEEKWKAEVAARAAAAAEGAGRRTTTTTTATATTGQRTTVRVRERGRGGGGGKKAKKTRLAPSKVRSSGPTRTGVSADGDHRALLRAFPEPASFRHNGSVACPPTGGAPAAAASAAATGNASAGAVAASKASKDADAKTREQ